MSEFTKLLFELLSQISSFFTFFEWDKKSYASVINCLLLEDDIAVKCAVDHLIKEKKALAIPPLYLSFKNHPNFLVRDYCKKALSKLGELDKIEKIVAGKNISTAMEDLIYEYGHFKKNYY